MSLFYQVRYITNKYKLKQIATYYTVLLIYTARYVRICGGYRMKKMKNLATVIILLLVINGFSSFFSNIFSCPFENPWSVSTCEIIESHDDTL